MHAHCRNHVRLYAPWWLVLLCLPLALASAGLAAPAPVAAQDVITITDLGTLGGPYSYALKVNNAGQVMGNSTYLEGSWFYHPWVWTVDEGMQDLGALGGDNAQGRFQNALGQIVGWSTTEPGAQFTPSTSFLWDSASGMVDLGTMIGAGGRVSSLNDLGQMVAHTPTGPFTYDTYVWSQDGTTQSIDWTGVGQVEIKTLSNSGDVIGNINDQNSMARQGFRWTAADGLTLVPITAYGVWLEGLNDLGVAAGQAVTTSTSPWSSMPFVWWADGSVTELGTLGGSWATVVDINNLGQVTGWSWLDPDVHGYDRHCYVWSPESGMVDIGTLGGSVCQPYAMNDLGQVVGESMTAELEIHAFFWSAETGMVDLGTLGGTQSQAVDINERGQVVGFSSLADTVFEHHAVLWAVPVPIATPEEAIGDAAELVETLLATAVLGEGEANALVTKLEAAQAQLDKGKIQPALNVLGAFVNQVEALVRSGRLSPEQAQPLLDAASEAIALIEDGP